jgi:hypothetical protein
VVVGLVRSADDTVVHFWGAPPRPPISTFAVARILFQWLTPRQAARIQPGKPGVLLATGEFIEGEFRGIAQGQVEVSSVLFGLRRFDLEDEVAAVVLRKSPPVTSSYAVRTVDGSTWLGRIVGIGQDEVLLRESTLGVCRIPVYELAEVRWGD